MALDTIYIILLTLAAFFILEGLFIAIWPKQVIKAFMEVKKKKLMRKLGRWEIYLGLLILLIVILLRTNI